MKLIKGGNAINGRGALAIAELLTVTTTLTKLDLKQNLFDDSAGLSIAKSIGVNLHLRHLVPQKFYFLVTPKDLSSNKLGNEAAVTFGESFQTNATLLKLILTNNEIRDYGAEALAKGLRENPVVIFVDLSLNDFDYRYAAMIQERCKFNQKNEYSTKATKYKKTIVDLVVSSESLHKLQDEISVENLKLKDANENLEGAQKVIEDTENDKETHIRILNNAISEQQKMIKDLSKDLALVNSEASKIRSDREQSYRSLLNRYHREKDVTLKLERKLRNVRNDYENTKIKCARDLRILEKNLQVANFDKNQAKGELDAVHKEIEGKNFNLKFSTLIFSNLNNN
jgi:predicted  nucleic acid-binding Zn-ribbon protein